MELVFIRHAATEWNEERRYQGSTDVPLCDLGRAQPIGWRNFLPAAPDFLWSSPMLRARETAEILYPGAKIQTHPALREMSLGRWEGRLMAEVKQELDSREWRGLDFADHGGESMRQVCARLGEWLKELEPAEGKVAVVVSHKAAITALFALATGWQLDHKPPGRPKFPKAHHFTWDGQKITVRKMNQPLESA